MSFADVVAQHEAKNGGGNASKSFADLVAEHEAKTQAERSQLSSALEGAGEGTGAPAALRLLRGNENTPEGWSRSLADQSSLLGTGALMATLGPIQGQKVSTALGAASGAFNASPAGKAWDASMVQDKGLGANLPSKVLGIEGLGTAANYASRIPSGIAQTFNSATPGGLMAALAGRAGAFEKPVAKAPVQTMPNTSSLLEQHGGSPLPSADLPNGIMRTFGKGVERLARTNPAGPEGMMEARDTKNVGAIKGYVEKKIPTAFESGLEGGQKLKDIVGAQAEQAGKNYKAVISQVKDLPAFANGEQVKAADSLNSILNTKDFVPDEAKKLIADTANRISKVKTPGEYDAEIKRFNYENQKLLDPTKPGMNTSLNHYFNLANEALKSSHYEALNNLSPGLGDTLKNTNFDYANQKGELFGPFARMAGGRLEDLPKKMLSGGEEFRNAAKEHLGKEAYGQLQDEALAAMFREAATKGTNGESVLNGQTLANLFGKKYKGMDWRPDQQEIIQNTLGMMDKAGINSLRQENASGTAGTSAKLKHTIAAFSGVGTLPVLGEAALEAAYLKAGRPIMKGIGKVGILAGRLNSVSSGMGLPSSNSGLVNLIRPPR